MFFESIETTGTRKKFPIAPRKRCSSTFPESSTRLAQEPPLRFCASSPPSPRARSLARRRARGGKECGAARARAAFILFLVSAPAPPPPHRDRERASHAH